MPPPCGWPVNSLRSRQASRRVRRSPPLRPSCSTPSRGRCPTRRSSAEMASVETARRLFTARTGASRQPDRGAVLPVALRERYRRRGGRTRRRGNTCSSAEHSHGFRTLSCASPSRGARSASTIAGSTLNAGPGIALVVNEGHSRGRTPVKRRVERQAFTDEVAQRLPSARR